MTQFVTVDCPRPSSGRERKAFDRVSAIRRVVLAVLSGTFLASAAQAAEYLHTLMDPVPRNDIQFGQYLSIHGRYALVSSNAYVSTAPGTTGPDGRVHLFDVETGALLHTFMDPATNGDLYNDFFGVSDINDSWIVVGVSGFGSSATSPRQGIVRVFSAATYELVRTIPNPDPASVTDFGRWIDLDGDLVAIGGIGGAYLYDLETGSQAGAFPSGHPAVSLDVANDRLAIGDRGAGGLSDGTVSIIRLATGSVVDTLSYRIWRTGGGTWFGKQVQVRDDTAVVSQQSDVALGWANIISVFDLNDPNLHVCDPQGGSCIRLPDESDILQDTATGSQIFSSFALTDTAVHVASGRGEALIFDRASRAHVETIPSPGGNLMSVAANEDYVIFGAPGLSAGMVGANRNVGGVHVYSLRPSNTAPVADAGPDQVARVGNTVLFDGTASSDDLTPVQSLVYSWSLVSAPAGILGGLDHADTAMPTLLIEQPGVYEVELVVFDEAGLASQPDTLIVNVDNLAPNADAGADQLVTVGSLVSLDGSSSTDPDDDPLTFSWQIASQPVGSIAALADGDSARPSFIADKLGAFEFRLIVSDSHGSDSVDLVAVTATIAADLDGDFDKDADDFQAFRTSLGKCEGNAGYLPRADFTGDACVSYDDYRVWLGL